MTNLSSARRFAAVIGVALSNAVVVVPALAAGEPKNQMPFTRHITARGLAQQVARSGNGELGVARLAAGDPMGEPKNELPFTHR